MIRRLAPLAMIVAGSVLATGVAQAEQPKGAICPASTRVAILDDTIRPGDKVALGIFRSMKVAILDDTVRPGNRLKIVNDLVRPGEATMILDDTVKPGQRIAILDDTVRGARFCIVPG